MLSREVREALKWFVQVLFAAGVWVSMIWVLLWALFYAMAASAQTQWTVLPHEDLLRTKVAVVAHRPGQPPVIMSVVKPNGTDWHKLVRMMANMLVMEGVHLDVEHEVQRMSRHWPEAHWRGDLARREARVRAPKPWMGE